MSQISNTINEISSQKIQHPHSNLQLGVKQKIICNTKNTNPINNFVIVLHKFHNFHILFVKDDLLVIVIENKVA